MQAGGQIQEPISLPPGKRPGTHCTEIWTGAENLSPSGIRYLERPARSVSLYRPGPNYYYYYYYHHHYYYYYTN